MCDNRLKIGKQLQKSTVPNSIIRTDANNEQQYVAPGAAGQILTIVGGVPTWSNPAVVPPSATLVDNGDGTFTYTDGATSFVIDTTDRLLTSVVYNPVTQDFTYTWSNGDVTVVDLTSLLNVYNLISGTNTVVTGDGLSTAWQVNGYGVTNNGDGTYSVSTPTGVGNFTINTNETVTTLTASLDNSDPLEPILVINYANEDGTNSVQNVNLAPLLDNTNTTYILIDNEDGTVSLEGSDGSNVVIDVCAIVAANCPTTLTANADGSFSFVGSDGLPVVIPAPVVATPSTITNTISGNRIATHTSGDGTIVDIKESVTSFAAITNGYKFVSEDGTVYPFTFLFDNSTPSAPQLLVQLNGVTQSAIPLNSYDVNIETTGGFVLNPLTDEITITETDGETHTIDLSYLRSTLTSTDGSVQLVTSVNPDGSTNYDLGVKAHSNETQAIPYTGTELPTTAGVNVGDTTAVQFNDGTIVDYTWDGTTWGPKIVDAPETVTTLDIVVGGAGLPNTATYTNEAGVPVSFNFIEGARNNLQLGSPIIERGNVNAGGGQPADFIRDIYNWMGSTFKDHWQSTGDAELVSFKAAQTINAANTTNSGAGAVNIGTAGANGQYKLNVLGAIWLDNGKFGTIVGANASRNATESYITSLGYAAGENAVGNFSTYIGTFAGSANNGANGVFVGMETGSFSNGNANTFIGRATGYSSIGGQSTGIGAYALQNNKQPGTIALGYEAGYQANAGYSVNIGHQAGYNTKGGNTINIGVTAGFNNDGLTNINIGNQAGRVNKGSDNIMLGSLAGEFNVGSSSIFIGELAGQNNVVGTTMGIGRFAAQNNVSSNLIAIGNQAGQNNKGTENIYLGIESGKDCNVDGDRSIGIGHNTLKVNNGFENLAIGYNALIQNTTGSRNVAIGTNSGAEITTGGNNTYLGWRSGQSNNGSDNVLLGESANDQKGENHRNVGVGAEVLHDNRNSNRNVAIGNYALYRASSMDAINMTAGDTYEIFLIGTTDYTTLGAANNNQFTTFTYNGSPISGNGVVRSTDLTKQAHNNVAVGYSAGNAVGTGQGNVFLGYEAGSTVSNQSNKLYIANTGTLTPLIGGDFLTQELKIGGVQQFSVQFPTSGAGVANGSMFYGTDGALYFKGGSGTITLIAAN